ncbi:hypothetical protein K1719_010921 [Acacia pycnantha]|nr:hypothetical protein K1719_010921 [Acacia pycnantha]
MECGFVGRLLIKECFTVNDKAFASRPKLVEAEVMGYNYGMVGFSPYGDYWRHVRKIATLEVLSSHCIEMLRHVRESEVMSAMKDPTIVGWKKATKRFVKQRDLFDLSGAFLISDALPYLRWLDLGGQEKPMRKTAKELDQFIQFWVDEHIRNRNSDSGQAKPKHGDFMDMLLSNTDEAEMIDGNDSMTMIKATSLVSLSHISLIFV